MSERRVPDATRAAQATASDPGNSAWVSAHAGSGKTHVLSERVIRLLLRGTDPSRILCLTYTRAAAANMSGRVFQRLAEWTQLADAELRRRIEATDGGKPTSADLQRARTLFATALETPGGLKVQTIHAFCESVLRQFPLEANIAAHFEMLDARMEAALVAEARRDLITGAAGHHDPVLAEAFATVLERGGEFGLDALLTEIVAKRDKLAAFLSRVRQEDGNFGPLFNELGLGADETAESIANACWPLPGFPPDVFEQLVVLAQRTNAAFVQKNILANAVKGFAEADPFRRLEFLAKGFLRADGDPYDPDKAFTKALRAGIPELDSRYLDAVSAIIPATERLALFRMAEGTRAALTVADRLIARYQNLKAGRGFLDFNDLINRTARLLTRPDAGAWVQYKLDQGIDHILIDEAQDTSPEQWAVVQALAGDFFSGAGARTDAQRTVFAVGDEKQSIYSFQGASPDAFARMGVAFRIAVRESGKPFEAVTLDLSFRSTQDVLESVDRTFRDEGHRHGVAGEAFHHNTIRFGEQGYVEVWPYIGADQRTEPEDWRESIDHATAPAVRIAEQVARTIKRWIDERELIHHRPKPGEANQLKARPVGPGDIMVLVRKRDRFVHALSRSLKQKLIPVAGADRLLLASHIAIKDLIALGRCLLQPEDDLALAAVLKSPLFGVTEDQLFRLAHDRPPDQSLDAWLRAKAPVDAHLTKIVDQLDHWTNEAAFKPPFEFYAAVLGRDLGRRRFIGRLGHEAGEILDEFLSFCLAEESVGLPGLEELLTTLETAGPEIKREMDQHSGEVRILTVHASKGLEAPIVFLVDSGGPPSIEAHLPRLVSFEMKGALKGSEGFLWRSSKDVANPRSRAIETELKQRADEEYRRLLYVGMTRAEDRLIVCGYYNVIKPKERTWMRMLEDTLGREDSVERFPHPAERDNEGLDPAFRFRVQDAVRLDAPKAGIPRGPELPIVPAQLTTPLPPQENLPRPLTPSGAALLIGGDDEPIVMRRSPVLGTDTADASALERGRLVHKLLQMLPELDPAQRNSAAMRYMERAAPDWSQAQCSATLSSVAGLLADNRFAPVFAAGSAAEVALAGTLQIRGRPRVVSGVVDRLAVTDSRILIIDYKTNRPPPATLADVPEAYVLQLALYAELLKPIYAGQQVEAALLFTESAELMTLPDDVMGMALARLTRA